MGRRRAGFTTRATCMLAAGVTAVICGLAFGEIDLVRAGVLAAAVPIVAALIVHQSRVRIANRREVEPTHVASGGSVTIHLTITNRALLRTGSLMLEDSLPEQINGRARFVLEPLGTHESRLVSYRVPGLGRGRYRVGPLRMRIADPFGLIDLTRSFTSTNEFVVTPIIDKLPEVDLPRSDELGDLADGGFVGSHGADDQSTREYRTGDDLRKIHWRSSARVGSLMVRQEERPWHGERTVLLDTRSHAHAGLPPGSADASEDVRLVSSFEWAVSAVASIGSHALLTGRRVALVDNFSSGERSRFSEPLPLASYLADVKQTPRPDLVQMANLLREASRDSTLIAVLGRIDADALRALAQARARGSSTAAFAMLLDVDSWAKVASERDVPEPSPESNPAMAAANVLRSAGWRVAIVRRGDSTAQAWQAMLAGRASASPTSTFSAAGVAAAAARAGQ